MPRVYTGDPFLARRSAIQTLSEWRQGDPTLEVVRLDDQITAERVTQALGQGGLFGRTALFVDLDEAFGTGQTAERNAVLDALEGAASAGAAPDDDVLVLDSAATPARKKRWATFAELVDQPTPRYGALTAWVQKELQRVGVNARGNVAATLTDLFGDDLPGIAGEVEKLALVDGAITPERVVAIAHRPAARSAFDLADAIAAGDAAAAIKVARGLLALGEEPIRVMAALSWQMDLIARCTALVLDQPRITAAVAAKALKASEFPTKKALAVAQRLDEPRLAAVVARTVAADAGMKSGRDPAWMLESLVVDLATAFARR
jgi:DNA polymerase-3 subunit delta